MENRTSNSPSGPFGKGFLHFLYDIFKKNKNRENHKQKPNKNEKKWDGFGTVWARFWEVLGTFSDGFGKF